MHIYIEIEIFLYIQTVSIFMFAMNESSLFGSVNRNLSSVVEQLKLKNVNCGFFP